MFGIWDGAFLHLRQLRLPQNLAADDEIQIRFSSGPDTKKVCGLSQQRLVGEEQTSQSRFHINYLFIKSFKTCDIDMRCKHAAQRSAIV